MVRPAGSASWMLSQLRACGVTAADLLIEQGGALVFVPDDLTSAGWTQINGVIHPSLRCYFLPQNHPEREAIEAVFALGGLDAAVLFAVHGAAGK